MSLEELNSLNEDELAMLWHAVNKTTPPVLEGVELEPTVFCSIRGDALVARINQLEPSVKESHKQIYDSLKLKLNIK